MPQRPSMLNETKKASPLAVFCGVLITLIVLILTLFAVFNVWVTRNCFVVEVSGTSMLNTVEDGDLLYVKKNTAPQRGDIVIISVKEYRDNEEFDFTGEFIIKRLIATAGDTVRCQDGVVSVKYANEGEFTVLTEPYIRGKTPDLKEEIFVEEGQIFFLGDNREVSYDSTEIGCLKASDIVGVVPEWSLKIRGFTAFWEGMRSFVTVNQ